MNVEASPSTTESPEPSSPAATAPRTFSYAKVLICIALGLCVTYVGLRLFGRVVMHYFGPAIAQSYVDINTQRAIEKATIAAKQHPKVSEQLGDDIKVTSIPNDPLTTAESYANISGRLHIEGSKASGTLRVTLETSSKEDFSELCLDMGHPNLINLIAQQPGTNN